MTKVGMSGSQAFEELEEECSRRRDQQAHKGPVAQRGVKGNQQRPGYWVGGHPEETGRQAGPRRNREVD